MSYKLDTSEQAMVPLSIEGIRVMNIQVQTFGAMGVPAGILASEILSNESVWECGTGATRGVRRGAKRRGAGRGARGRPKRRGGGRRGR